MEKITTNIKPTFDLTKIYAKYKKCLVDAKQGEVVTRFPPEPSGYLHVGHVKAAFLNYHYAKIFDGKMILRFDDTNPSKESQEFIDNIKQDLTTLEVYPDKVTHTSDSFPIIIEYCTKMIENGDAYCDNTPVEQMREERMKGLASGKRDTPVEENLRIWEEMQKFSEEGKQYCVRAKLSFNNKNGCLRDPTMFRCMDNVHPHTGDKYKVYPTYDFACPIVDSIDGVTHALRTTEYNDRKEQYEWFLKKLGLKKIKIQEYSRLAFVNTIMSKRHLKNIVDEGVVEGWTDPRFPTVQGILRRGMTLETLVEFMLDQGPSRNCNLMEWDKIWALNKQKLENLAGRYNCVYNSGASYITVDGIPEQLQFKSVDVHKKNPSLGMTNLYWNNKFIIGFDDAQNLKEGEKLTLMNHGNVLINKITPPSDSDSGYHIEATNLPEDLDYKDTQKITWICSDKSVLSKVELIEFDHLLKKAKLEDGEKLADFLNRDSKFVTEGLADAGIKSLDVGSFVQFQRIGNYRIDKRFINADGETITQLIFIPTGKSKGMSNITTKVSAKDTAKGGAL